MPVRYVSTRGGMQPATFTEVLLEGLAPDGGLIVPEEFPRFTFEQLEGYRGITYPNVASEVIGLFATDIPRLDLDGLTGRAYATEKFLCDEIVPLKPTGDIWILGLSEGPTLAFKDMAMQFLGQAIEYALERRGGTLNILGATSGDTGSAAEHAFLGKDHVSVFMLSPQGRMSEFQRAQMYSLQDDNIHNIAMEGVFDDAQAHVKALMGDLEFKHRYRLGAVNSINLGRIVAQLVYYVWAYLRLTDDMTEDARHAFRFSVTVPSGNFGNILAGHFARRMGLPIHRLVLASNENNVLAEFFETGLYRPRDREHTYATSSPSMDISRASNLERFVFDLVGRDPERLRETWGQLDATGEIDLTAHLDEIRERYGFRAGSSTHADRVETIRRVHAEHDVLIDPHTADGVKVAWQHVEPGVPMVVLETAKAAKFADIVREATGKEPEIPEPFQTLTTLPQRVTELANDEDALRAFIAEHAQLTPDE